jgi:hypothetical protein
VRASGTPEPTEVGTQLSVAGAYRPPVFKPVRRVVGLSLGCPPQTIISVPVQTRRVCMASCRNGRPGRRRHPGIVRGVVPAAGIEATVIPIVTVMTAPDDHLRPCPDCRGAPARFQSG